MKGLNLIITGAIALIVGILMLIFRTQLANGGIVISAGALFIVAGVLNMTVFLGSRDSQGRAGMGALGTAFGWIASAAAVVLGLAMLIFNMAFVALISFVFAVMLLFAALFQLFLLIFWSRPTHLPNCFFLVPAALVAAAIYIFLRKTDTPGEIYDIIFMGISFVIFGVFTIIEGSIIGRANHAVIVKSAQPVAVERTTDESNTDI